MQQHRKHNRDILSVHDFGQYFVKKSAKVSPKGLRVRVSFFGYIKAVRVKSLGQRPPLKGKIVQIMENLLEFDLKI